MVGKISQDKTVPFTPSLFLPAIDMTRPLGSQNVKVAGSSLVETTAFPFVTPQQFGAIGDGVADDTAAIQAAVATGKRVYLPTPAVCYCVKDAISCTTKGQIIQGDGKGVTIICVDSSFNLSALGVFVCPGGPWVPGPQFRDFQINFAQPDTTVYNNLVAYPPAFYAEGVARGSWHGIKINAGKTGIDLRLNAAGTTVADCELCCFDKHIVLDGEADSVMVSNVRFEPDLLTANQTTVYNQSSIGINVGRCDDLHVSGCLFFCHLGIEFVVGADGNGCQGNVTNCDFDTYSGINIQGPTNLEVAGCMFTLGTPTSYAIEMNGYNLSVSACWFLGDAPLTNAMVLVNGAIVIQFSSCRFDLSGDYSAVNVFGNTNISLVGCMFNWAVAPTADRANPIVGINASCLVSMSSCRFAPVAGITGHALDCVDDGKHNVCGNTFNNWSVNMYAGPNHVFANNN
jgi:Pectate lyase superfamily protein